MTEEETPLTGRTAAVRGMERSIESAARSDGPVLIYGESGAGKKAVARTTHSRSERHLAPMLSISCAGVPDPLLESQLFGHVRDSFVGAYCDRPGTLQAAHGGTVFMDEVCEMSAHIQALVVRFLETGESRRVGDDRLAPRIDVRVIAATSRNLAAEIACGLFRQDLFDRLNVIQIAVPPVRERADDIALWVEQFSREFQRDHRVPVRHFTPEALECLQSYPWPGNLDEMRDVVERLAIASPGGTVRPENLPFEMRRIAQPKAPSLKPAPRVAVAQIPLGS